MLLEEIKILLGIETTDISQDVLLTLYIRRAVFTIKNYLNTDKYSDDEIVILFPDAVISLVVDTRRLETSRAHVKGIKSETQGARSTTYSDANSFSITSSIKALLPTPYIKMR